MLNKGLKSLNAMNLSNETWTENIKQIAHKLASFGQDGLRCLEASNKLLILGPLDFFLRIYISFKIISYNIYFSLNITICTFNLCFNIIDIE